MLAENGTMGSSSNKLRRDTGAFALSSEADSRLGGLPESIKKDRSLPEAFPYSSHLVTSDASSCYSRTPGDSGKVILQNISIRC